VAFLAGQIDATEYRAEARRLVLQESLDLDS
jgi:hypothetical protein